MTIVEKTVTLYLTIGGESPFIRWYHSLKDKRANEIILARIARVRSGNIGDFKIIGNGVFEFRIHYGSGFRIYFGLENNEIVILLVGGDKSTQARDIKKAKEYWHDYKKKGKSQSF